MKAQKTTFWVYNQAFISINFACILAFLYMNFCGFILVPYLGLLWGSFVMILPFHVIGPWCLSFLVYMSSVKFYELSKSFSLSQKAQAHVYAPLRNIPTAMASIWLFLTVASVFHEQRIPWHTACEVILLASSAGMLMYGGYKAMQSARALDVLIRERE